MKKVLKSIVAVALMASMTLGTPEIAEVLGYAGSSVVASAASTSTPKTPTASLKSGTYTTYKAKQVTLKCETKNAKIYYSLDDGSYKSYTKPVEITKNSTLKFYAKVGNKKSKVVSRTYKLAPDVDISAPTGDYPVEVTFSTLLDGVTCYYTTDGSKPTKKSKKLTDSKLTFKKSCTLRVLAVKAGWSWKYYTVKVHAKKADYQPSILNDYTKKFYYSLYEGDYKTAYERVYKAAQNYEKMVDVSDLKIKYGDAINLVNHVIYDNPQLFWVWANPKKSNPKYNNDDKKWYTESIELWFVNTEEDVKKRTPKLEKMVEEAVKKAQKEPTDYLCIKSLHDFLMENTAYEHDNDGKTHELSQVDKMLIDGAGVCGGYSQAFSYLCQAAGYQCFTIGGDVDIGSHAWSKAKIGDSWYYFDTTWDDLENGYYYNCFSMNEEEFGKSHTPGDERVYEAVADSDLYTYENAAGLIRYDSVDEFIEKGMIVINEGLAEGKLSLSLCYKEGLRDKVNKHLLSKLHEILEQYSIYAPIACWAFSDNRLDISFKSYETVDDVVEKGMKTVAENYAKGIFTTTIPFKKGLRKSVYEAMSDFYKILENHGAYVLFDSWDWSETGVTITLKPYETLDQVLNQGVKTIAGGFNNGLETVTIHYKKGLKKSVKKALEADFNKLMKKKGVYATLESMEFTDTYVKIKMSGYKTTNEFVKKGMKIVADNFNKGVYTTTLRFEKGLRSPIYEKMSDFYNILRNHGASGFTFGSWEWTETSITITLKKA